MAHFETHGVAHSDLPHRIWNAIKAAPKAIFDGLVSISEANQRVMLVERLQAKSDSDLAAMGLKREDIVRYVFRDMFHV